MLYLSRALLIAFSPNLSLSFSETTTNQLNFTVRQIDERIVDICIFFINSKGIVSNCSYNYLQLFVV